MTTPSSIPALRFRASVIGTDIDGAVVARADDAFTTTRQARAWVRELLASSTQQPEPTRGEVSAFRAVIADTVESRFISRLIYDLNGSAGGLTELLADALIPAAIDAATISTDRAAASVPNLLHLYGQVSAEALRNPGDPELLAKRTVVRGALSMATDGLDPTQHREVGIHVGLIDLIPLAQPEGAIIVTLEATPATKAAGMGQLPPMREVDFEAVAGQRFGSKRHAREWLGLMGDLHADRQVLRAVLTETRPDGTLDTVTLTSNNGRLDRTASGHAGFDGTLVTGITGVDNTRLTELITRYRGLAAESPTYEFLPTEPDGSGTVMRHAGGPSAIDALGMEIAFMITDPAMTDDLTELRQHLAHADRGRRTSHNTVSDTVTVPSSGFVGADIQITLDQHHSLHSDLDRATDRELPVFHALIAEARTRVHDLLAQPSLTATDRIEVLDTLARAEAHPDQGSDTIFRMPSVTALTGRMQQCQAQPLSRQPPLRGRDTDDMLRLYQLVCVIEETAEPRHGLELRRLKFDLGEALRRRINEHPGLHAGERAALTSLAEDLRRYSSREIPTGRVESVAEPVPLDQLRPVALDTLDNYRVAFTDPRQPDRHVVAGTEYGRWTVREYRTNPAHPQWKNVVGAAAFAHSDHMLAALIHGIEITDETGTPRRMRPIHVPHAVLHRLADLQTELNRHTATPSNPAAAPKSPVAPTERAKPRIAKQPGVKPRRRLG